MNGPLHPNTQVPTGPGPKRAAYTAGLRMLADILDAHPDVPLPSGNPMLFYVGAEPDPGACLAAVARAFPGALAGRADENYFRIEGRLEGLAFSAFVGRDDIRNRAELARAYTTADRALAVVTA